MSKNKPVLQDVKPINKPVLGKGIKDQANWSFSFKHFKQIEKFGLGETDAKWYLALLERLKDLSNQKVDVLLSDYTARDAYRFHPINWNAINIPIQRKDFNWIDNNILNNEDEYPFFQFQISTALGRVIGYFDENHEHFYILLLDHKHNMQPSKKFNYNVNDTTVLFCDYSSLLMDVDRVRGLKCPVDECKCKSEINAIPTKAGRGKFIYVNIDDEYYEELEKLIEDKSLKEIIQDGILSSI